MATQAQQDLTSIQAQPDLTLASTNGVGSVDAARRIYHDLRSRNERRQRRAALTEPGRSRRDARATEVARAVEAARALPGASGPRDDG